MNLHRIKHDVREQSPICPRCKKGRMRPTGKAGVDRQVNEPFGEVSEGGRFECDNCGHVKYDANITERVEVDDSLSDSVEKKK